MGMKERKHTAKYILSGILLLLLVAGVVLCALLFFFPGNKTDNLSRMGGVKVTCDSVENETYSAKKAIDGDPTSKESRWSSENNRESAAHYLQLAFPKEVTVSYVVLYWERLNVNGYGIEASSDGEHFEVLHSFNRAPSTNRQEIVFEQPTNLKYLRIFTTSVLQNEEDLTVYYQNVSLYEVEVYEKTPAAYQLEAPTIVTREDGSRYLEHPAAPEGYRVSFLGADLEQIIGEDGTVYDNIEEKTVTVGYRVQKVLPNEEATKQENAHMPQAVQSMVKRLHGESTTEAIETSFKITVPARASQAALSDGAGDDTEKRVEGSAAGTTEGDTAVDTEDTTEVNVCPRVVPEIAEWRGGYGEFRFTKDTIFVADQDIWNKESEDSLDRLLTHVDEGLAMANRASDFVVVANQAEASTDKEETGELQELHGGDVYLTRATEDSGLGEEGYYILIEDEHCTIFANTNTGFYYGMTTFVQLACQNEGVIPCGEIRDYPLYAVRGFGIDVARKKVSMDTLYDILEMMSYYKMNDLEIHLNDNTILTTSGMADTIEHAMQADSAFRMAARVENPYGEKLTSSDYAYTKEEFAGFVEDAKAYGVKVVPEFDTPAHSLAITKRFPEYALTTRNEAVDQIDLSNKEAVALVRSIWDELLVEENAPFAGAEIINIGMDEYYGDGEQFRKYMTDTAAYVKQQGKTVRLWGSLSNVSGETMPATEDLQMNLWSLEWANPTDMYRAGYDLINMQSNHLYLIPGGGYDRLDADKVWKTWEPYRYFEDNYAEELPVYSKQLLGAAYMLWNDMSDSLDVGLCEYDLYERFEEALPVFAGKLWGKARTEELPSHWIRLEKADRLMPSYQVVMRVSLPGQEDPSGEQVLAEGEGVYADWKFYAVEPETGKVGFTREGRTYTFDYVLPTDRTVELKVVGEPGVTSLYADDQLVGTLGQGVPFEEHATFVFPLEKLGEETGSFSGELEIVRVEAEYK